MKMIYETPVIEVTVIGTAEDILLGSDNEVIIDISELWS